MLTGIILQYMYYKSGSILTVSLMHGMLNITGTFIFAFVVINEYQYFIDGPTGIIGLTILFMIAVFCYKRFPIHESDQDDLSFGEADVLKSADGNNGV